MTRVFILLAVVCLSVVASTKPCKESQEKSVILNFNRDINAKIKGQVKFGPCGRPKSNIDVGIKDKGETKIQGNAFQALETLGKFAEFLKLLGNRFKPEVNCPPRPASNVDTSAEDITSQRTVKRKPGRSSGKFICKNHSKIKKSRNKSKRSSQKSIFVKVHKAKILPINKSLEKANEEYRALKHNQRRKVNNYSHRRKQGRKKRRGIKNVKRKGRKNSNEKKNLGSAGYKDFEDDVMKNIKKWSKSLKKKIYGRKNRCNLY